MFNFMFALLVSLHVIACLLFWLGCQYEYFRVYIKSQANHWSHWLQIKSPDQEVPNKSWITEVKLVVNTCDKGTCESGRTNILEAPMSGQYLMSVYWVTTTMTQVGYGDMRPFTQYEVISLLFAMVLGASLFSYIVGNAKQLIDELQVNISYNICVCLWKVFPTGN